MARTLCTAAAVLLLLALGWAREAAAVVRLTCDNTNSAEVTVNAITTKATVSCPSGCKTAVKTLWGTGVYTSDSPICRSAIHAGKITNSGGQFTLYYEKGRSSYTGSVKNGISSQSYGTWRSSFKFGGPALGPSISCDKTNANRDVVGVGQVGYNRTKLTVACPAGCLAAGGSVYGTGAYTSDSRICLAAIHAGVLKNTGGLITIYDYPGLKSYRGSTANSVKTLSYGSWGHSYRFRPVVSLACSTTNGPNLLVNATRLTAYATCPMDCLAAGGNVFGTSTAYRSNSRICLAAIHAGVITSNGGSIILRYVKGLSAYTGTTANFVTSKAAAASPNAVKFM